MDERDELTSSRLREGQAEEKERGRKKEMIRSKTDGGEGSVSSVKKRERVKKIKSEVADGHASIKDGEKEKKGGTNEGKEMSEKEDENPSLSKRQFPKHRHHRHR